MKRILLSCALAAGVLTCTAQSVVDSFNVGPYTVDYLGNSEVKYRLRDNVDLYEFFELAKDTIIQAEAPAPVEVTPVKHAIEVSIHYGASSGAGKQFGVEGVWKQKIAKNLYFNGGLQLDFDVCGTVWNNPKASAVEIGIPLQIELGNLNRQKASLYGNIGIVPAVYSTMKLEKWNPTYKNYKDADNETGFVISPRLELGANVPVGSVLLRIGVYGEIKCNCTDTDIDIYKSRLSNTFFGAKVGIVL